MGAAAGDAPQFVSMLQLWTAWSLCTELPNAAQAKPAVEPGQVHYTTLEGILEGPPVMEGTFSVNEQPVTVLFDSGASHTFISEGCFVRLWLKIESMPKPYHIHSPGGKLITNQFVKQVPLQLQEKIFPTALIILPTQRVDVYIGQ